MDLSWVTPRLAVGGAVPCEAVPRLASRLAIRRVVDLREEACDDAALLAVHGIALLHLPTADHAPIEPASLACGIEFVCEGLARRERVLVHCQHGIGRSVTLAAAALVREGYPLRAAIEAIKDCRACASPSPAQLEQLLALAADGATFDELAAIAYRHLARRR
jgi:protein-tyrosine phosphatase